MLYTAKRSSFAFNYDIDFTCSKQYNMFFHVLYSDKTWIFDQSEHTQGPIYILNVNEQNYKLYCGQYSKLKLLNWVNSVEPQLFGHDGTRRNSPVIEGSG